MNKSIYKKEIKQIQHQIAIVKELDRVNIKLHQFNWVFLHPYSQGIDIGYIDTLVDKNDPEKIFHFFANRFLNLRATIHLIDGFYKQRPFLQDYTGSIEESVLLCLQKDFKAAIYILIPVIEGTLRKYLVSKEGEGKRKEIDSSKLLNTIKYLREDYLNLTKKYLRIEHKASIAAENYLDANQEKALLEKHGAYFDLWMTQFQRFMQNSLYKRTKEEDPIDKFNRHLIFHALDDNIEFTFANYLRLFSCVNYLSWVLGLTHENCSVLSTANEDEVFNKWIEYLKVFALSDSLSTAKTRILKHESQNFNYFLPKEYNALLEGATREISEIVSNYEFLKNVDGAKINSIPRLFKGLLFLNNVRKAKNRHPKEK